MAAGKPASDKEERDVQLPFARFAGYGFADGSNQDAARIRWGQSHDARRTSQGADTRGATAAIPPQEEARDCATGSNPGDFQRGQTPRSGNDGWGPRGDGTIFRITGRTTLESIGYLILVLKSGAILAASNWAILRRLTFRRAAPIRESR
jgi:hypothetical protein